jgi:hypothetical protein
MSNISDIETILEAGTELTRDEWNTIVGYINWGLELATATPKQAFLLQRLYTQQRGKNLTSWQEILRQAGLDSPKPNLTTDGNQTPLKVVLVK